MSTLSLANCFQYIVAASYPRSHHGCVNFDDGKVLIAGGSIKKNNVIAKTDSVQVFFCIYPSGIDLN